MLYSNLVTRFSNNVSSMKITLEMFMIDTKGFKYFSHKSMRTFILGFLLLFCMISLFAEPQQEISNPQNLRTVIDMRGRSVEIPENINSIVALGAGSLRLVTYLNAADKVVAVEDLGNGREKTSYDFFNLATYRIAYPELQNLPSIGSIENHEGLINASPDLIIASYTDISQLDQLQNTLGIPVFAVNVDVEFYETDLFYHQIELLGEVLDKKERAEELVTGIKAVLKDIENRAQKVSTPKRVYAGGMMFYGPANLLRTTGDFLPFDLTNSENVMPTNPTGNLQPYMTSLEDFIAASPDYIFIDAANVKLSKAGFEDNKKVLEEQVPAFKNHNVYTTFVYKYYGTNWENQLINVYLVGKTLYPDLYFDINKKNKATEIWDLFFSVALDYDNVCEKQKSGPEQVDWFN